MTFYHDFKVEKLMSVIKELDMTVGEAADMFDGLSKKLITYKEFEFIVDPMGKPRMTRRDKWLNPPRPAVKKYWQLKAQLTRQANKMKYTVEPILSIDFYIKMPKSWSKKKKDQFRGKPHQSKPDLSNLVKAFEDCLCEDDSFIWSYKDMNKYWSDEGSVIVRS